MIDTEELVGQLVTELGLARPEQVKECLALLNANDSSPQNKSGLVPLLLKKGYLNLTQFEKTLNMEPSQEHEKTVLDQKNSPQDTPPRQTPKGESFGKYIKTQLLGTGGMGDVWKCWDTELERWVAIKFLRGGDEADLARFRREAQTAAKLTHPGITSIYEAGEDFIAMQFIDGDSLSNLPQGDYRLIAEAVRQSAEALHFAHQNGIMHRDIKPANILFRKNQEIQDPLQQLEIFLTDFGLAKPMDVDSSLSVTGALMGTPSYMSPEQADGHRSIDSRTDIYSLGATLYYLIAGKLPFFDPNAYQIAKKVIEEEPIPIRKLAPEVPLDLQTITMKCMEKDPSARYGNALEIAEELNRFLNNEPIHARPISKTEKALRYIKTHRSILVPSTIAAVLCLGILGWIGTSSYLESRQVDNEIKQTRDYLSQATGEAYERVKLYRLASQSIEGAVMIDPDNEEALHLQMQINAALEKIEQEAEAEQKKLKERLAEKRKITLMAKVLGGWERLHETLEDMEAIHFDSTLTPEERVDAQKDNWKRISDFKNTIPEDPSSQSMGLALTGWSRFIAGNEKEGIEWINEARKLEPLSPYGVFLKSLIRFEETLQKTPMIRASKVKGVRWWEPDDLKEIRNQILSLLEEIQPNSLWVEESQEDYRFAMQGITCFLQGKYEESEAAFSEAIAAPQMIVFQADFRMARAEARIFQGKYSEAIEDLEKTLQLRPRQFLPAFLLGQVYEALSQKRPGQAKQIQQYRTQAILYYEKAGALSRNCWQAWIHAGALQEEAGQKKKAANSYLQAMDITSTMNPKPGLSKLEAAFKRVRGK